MSSSGSSVRSPASSSCWLGPLNSSSSTRVGRRVDLARHATAAAARRCPRRSSGGRSGSSPPTLRPPGSTGSSSARSPVGHVAGRRVGLDGARRRRRSSDATRGDGDRPQRIMRRRRSSTSATRLGGVVDLVVGRARGGEELDHEAGAGRAVGAVLDPDPPAVHADVLVDEGEPEAGALAATAPPGGHAAGEALEDQGPLLDRHARAVVLDADLDVGQRLVGRGWRR